MASKKNNKSVNAVARVSVVVTPSGCPMTALHFVEKPTEDFRATLKSELHAMWYANAGAWCVTYTTKAHHDEVVAFAKSTNANVVVDALPKGIAATAKQWADGAPARKAAKREARLNAAMPEPKAQPKAKATAKQANKSANAELAAKLASVAADLAAIAKALA